MDHTDCQSVWVLKKTMKQKQTQAMAGAGEKENAESAMGMKMKKQGHGRTNANQNTKQYTIANEKNVDAQCLRESVGS